MARLNKHIDRHFKTHYKVVEYNIKQPQTRVPEITTTIRLQEMGQKAKGQKIMHQKSQVPYHITHTLDRGKNSHKEADKKAFL